jgi:FAD/FMN-containing dehydrogenase
MIAARGGAHSTFGQSQVADGLVLDMGELNGILEVGEDYALVEGGCTWAALVEKTSEVGLSPPALTDYLNISVGATLSLGGVGGASFRYGTQTDNVIDLDVVTGTGELVHCSSSENVDLFDAVRAGLGQCGIIVRARLRLIQVPPRIRMYQLRYASLQPFLEDQNRLAREERFEYIDGTVINEAAGFYSYKLTLAKQHTPDREPDHKALLSGLNFVQGGLSSEGCGYLDFALRVEEYVLRQRRKGHWDCPHPWFDVFLPADRVEHFIERTRGELTDECDGMILTYVLRRSRSTTPMLALPDDCEWIYLFDVLRNSMPGTDGRNAELLAMNQKLLEECVAVGGGVYPIGAVPRGPKNWERQYPRWKQLRSAKTKFDPDGIMTPGHNLFERGVRG